MIQSLGFLFILHGLRACNAFLAFRILTHGVMAWDHLTVALSFLMFFFLLFFNLDIVLCNVAKLPNFPFIRCISGLFFPVCHNAHLSFISIGSNKCRLS